MSAGTGPAGCSGPVPCPSKLLTSRWTSTLITTSAPAKITILRTLTSERSKRTAGLTGPVAPGAGVVSDMVYLRTMLQGILNAGVVERHQRPRPQLPEEYRQPQSTDRG